MNARRILSSAYNEVEGILNDEICGTMKTQLEQVDGILLEIGKERFAWNKDKVQEMYGICQAKLEKSLKTVSYEVADAKADETSGSKSGDSDRKNGIEKKTQKRNFSGEYLNESGAVSVKELPCGKIEFEIRVSKGGENGCVGELEKQVLLLKDNIAVLDAEDCKLSLTFTENTVEVSEKDCSMYYGMNCFFDGTYALKSSLTDKKTEASVSVGKKISSMFDTFEPGGTVEYKNGKRDKSESEENKEAEHSAGPHAKDIYKKQWVVSKSLRDGNNVVFFFYSEKCESANGELRQAEIRGSGGEDDMSGTEKLLEKGCWKADIGAKQIIYVSPNSRLTPSIQGFQGTVAWQELSDLSGAN